MRGLIDAKDRRVAVTASCMLHIWTGNKPVIRGQTGEVPRDLIKMNFGNESEMRADAKSTVSLLPSTPIKPTNSHRNWKPEAC